MSNKIMRNGGARASDVPHIGSANDGAMVTWLGNFTVQRIRLKQGQGEPAPTLVLSPS